MKTDFRYEDGTKVPDGVCIRPLVRRTTLTVTLDTMDSVSPSLIMQLLKTKWGCREVQIESEMVICKGYTKNAPKVGI
jgi:hypothetical protein